MQGGLSPTYSSSPSKQRADHDRPADTMAPGNHPPAYYTASISFSEQSTYYVSGDRRPRDLFEADNGILPAGPPRKRQRRVEDPTSKSMAF